jgi:hypothetical protein
MWLTASIAPISSETHPNGFYVLDVLYVCKGTKDDKKTALPMTLSRILAKLW